MRLISLSNSVLFIIVQLRSYDL